MAASRKKEILSFVEQKQTISILNALNTQRASGLFCDVILKVCGHEFPAHSNVLAAGSTYLTSLLSENVPRIYSQGSPQTIEVHVDSAETDKSYILVVEAILNFLYTGRLQIPVILQNKLSEIAGILQVSPLIKFCQGIKSQHRKKHVRAKGYKVEEDEGEEDLDTSRVPPLGDDGGESTDLESKLSSTGRPLRSTRLGKRKSYLPQRRQGSKEDEQISETEQNETKSDVKESPDNTPKKKKKTQYQCEKCDFTTCKPKELSKHQDWHKQQENICKFCDEHFEDGSQLEEHLEKHSGPEPYFCPSCDQRFNTKTKYNMHAPVHFKEKPFICETCGAGFKWKHALKNHEVIHSTEKKHLCDFCGYSTVHKSQLKAHRLIHTGNMFSCEVPGCNFKATKRQNLKNHMLTHTREKPHQCEICGTAFSMVKNLRRHSSLHTTVRPFKCDICDFSTTRMDKLREHLMKSHSIGEPPKKRQTLEQKYGGTTAEDADKEEKKQVTNKLTMPFKLIFPMQENQLSIVTDPATHGLGGDSNRRGISHVADQKFFAQVTEDNLAPTGQQSQQPQHGLQTSKQFPYLTKVIIPAGTQENSFTLTDSAQFITQNACVTEHGLMVTSQCDTHLVTSRGQKLIVTQGEILGGEGGFQQTTLNRVPPREFNLENIDVVPVESYTDST
ncbi:myoneurin [Lingula anatina]|uniref:Myoneurin n=1 Tax=Lingula anatina TaxID=7574 RepID=A0A1S3K5E7_LINAN|nr:myoneurin [Lingula anatina]|eukprot:XP_013417644.1 myoneurin [Lingula anatina]